MGAALAPSLRVTAVHTGPHHVCIIDKDLALSGPMT